MHDGCTGGFTNGKQIVDKIRMMGFSDQLIPVPLEINCHSCEKEFVMEEFEASCPSCGMVHGVTPCHAFDPNNVMSAGIDY
ncbi:MAG: hydrogenase maturation nickel metallochaperone HypA [Marinifilaceae bacterium]|jgi:hypothetical protein|nr:hydrogenase maturation nickel metallochaperone HypA [Marinifilaceae bacterium]